MSTREPKVRPPARQRPAAMPWTSPSGPSPSAIPALPLWPQPDPDLEHEKRGLIEALLAAERYRALLVVGCGTVALAEQLSERCGSCTGMDVDVHALRRVHERADAGRTVPGRFVPLSVPFRLPSGRHELVVLSGALALLGTVAVPRLARELDAHRPCREIVVVSPLDETAADPGGDTALAALVEALAERFVHHELAVRRRYRIDALLRADEGGR